MEIEIPDTQEEISQLAFRIRAYETYEKRSGYPPKHPFIYTSRILSPDFLDMRLFNGNPEERPIVISRLVEKFRKTGAEVAGGCVSGDLTYLGVVAHLAGVPCFYVREEEKVGVGRTIEGMRREQISGRLCAHVGDLLTTGRTAENLAILVRDASGLISYHIPIASRLQGGEERLAQLEPPVVVKSLFIMDESFYEIGLKMGAFTEEFLEEKKRYNADQGAWARNYLRNHPEFFLVELQRNGVIRNGQLRKPEALEVLTKAYSDLKNEFTPQIRRWLEELGVTHPIPEFSYRV